MKKHILNLTISITCYRIKMSLYNNLNEHKKINLKCITNIKIKRQIAIKSKIITKVIIINFKIKLLKKNSPMYK